MDDEFQAFVRIKNLGNTSVLFLVSIRERRTGKTCCALEILQLYVDLETARSTPIPQSLRHMFEAS